MKRKSVLSAPLSPQNDLTTLSPINPKGSSNLPIIYKSKYTLNLPVS